MMMNMRYTEMVNFFQHNFIKKDRKIANKIFMKKNVAL